MDLCDRRFRGYFLPFHVPLDILWSPAFSRYHLGVVSSNHGDDDGGGGCCCCCCCCFCELHVALPGDRGPCFSESGHEFPGSGFKRVAGNLQVRLVPRSEWSRYSTRACHSTAFVLAATAESPCRHADSSTGVPSWALEIEPAGP